MYAVSDRWDSAVRSSNPPACRVEVWRNGVNTGAVLSVTSGTVRVDGSSRVRRALSMTSSDLSRMPNDTNDLLRPTDTDLKVFAGVTYTEGDTELVPVFTGRVQEPSRGGWFDPLSVTAVDYAKVLEDARFVRPWNVPRGSNERAFSLLKSLVQDVLPWVQVFNLTGRNGRIGSISFDKSRTEAMDLLAHLCGGEWWFTPDGDCVVGKPVRATPVTGEVDWVVDAGTETSVLINSGQSLSSEKVFNAVTATSAPQDGKPVSVTVYVNKGPFRYRPGFQRPRFWKTSLPATTAELTDVARYMLSRRLQLVTRVPASCAPNPALDAGDLVQVAIPDGSTVVRIVNGFDLPLTPADIGSDGMSLDLAEPIDLSTEDTDVEV